MALSCLQIHIGENMRDYAVRWAWLHMTTWYSRGWKQNLVPDISDIGFLLGFEKMRSWSELQHHYYDRHLYHPLPTLLTLHINCYPRLILLTKYGCRCSAINRSINLTKTILKSFFNFVKFHFFVKKIEALQEQNKCDMYCYSNVHHQLGIHLLLIKNMVTGTFLLKKKWQIKLFTNKWENIKKKFFR